MKYLGSLKELRAVFSDIPEFAKTLHWYLSKKGRFLLVSFEETKGIVVDLLLMHRGAYQSSFLRIGLVGLILMGSVLSPILVSSYPRSSTPSDLNALVSTPQVLAASADINSMDTVTQESEKPRRDVLEYEVKSGDTISGIAKDNGVDVASIKFLNPKQDVNLLHPGDVIKIPPVTGLVVTVASGDSVYSLAKKYSLPSAQSIVDWPYNTFVDDNTFALASGQTLVIPGGVPPEEAPAPRILQQTPSQSTLFANGTGTFSWPTAGVITQYFSWYHGALDIASNSRPGVNAADSGRVISVLYDNHDYGYHVIIDHGNGYKTLYAHLSRIDINQGDNVSRGQHLGVMGSTGRSTGPHLHFTVYLNGASVNPLSLLR